MLKMFTKDDLDTMQMVRCAFDPAGISNPGKVFPTPRLCGEVPRKHHASDDGATVPAVKVGVAGVVEVF